MAQNAQAQMLADDGEEETLIARPVPYFCQWESPSLALDIIEGRATPADDPSWAASGAGSRDEYAKWANHVCGMACLRMILAARMGKNYPTLELLRRSLPYGAYTEKDGAIHGMIYAPFVEFVRKEFGLKAAIKTNLAASDIPALMAAHDFFIASVHPGIRWPEGVPPKKGGHLILVTGAANNAIIFHNPSGHEDRTRENAKITITAFDKFFAGRGVVIYRE